MKALPLVGLLLAASAHAQDVMDLTMTFRQSLLNQAMSSRTSVRLTSQRPVFSSFGSKYRCHTVTSTIFWIGEPAKRDDPGNCSSAFDHEWLTHYGGCDSPTQRFGLLPARFVPLQNPFYIALPVSDILNGRTLPEAEKWIPWYHSTFVRDGQSILKDRWVELTAHDRRCYAQWEDCGPFSTCDWSYVFGSDPPKHNRNFDAGIDCSPAVRDALGLADIDQLSWRFCEARDVPPGPWARRPRSSCPTRKERKQAMTREEKLATFRDLTKLPNVKTGRQFADEKSNRARIFIDHPHAYRDWIILGPASDRGFWHLESSFRLTGPLEQIPINSSFYLCLHESEFERIG